MSLLPLPSDQKQVILQLIKRLGNKKSLRLHFDGDIVPLAFYKDGESYLLDRFHKVGNSWQIFLEIEIAYENGEFYPVGIISPLFDIERKDLTPHFQALIANFLSPLLDVIKNENEV